MVVVRAGSAVCAQALRGEVHGVAAGALAFVTGRVAVADSVERHLAAGFLSAAAPVRPAAVVASPRLLLGHAILVVLDDGERVARAFLAGTVSQVTTGTVSHLTGLFLERARPDRPAAVFAC